MAGKPNYLRPDVAAAFQDPGVVDRYHYREPYPPEIFETLKALIRDEPRAVLDIGTGTGELARAMLDFAERVDAVDWSEAMIEKGKTQPSGDDPRLRWIYGRMEEVALDPPYALITAGASLHWMDWDVLLPRLAAARTPHGFLAIVDRRVLPRPWTPELVELVKRFSTNPDYVLLDLIAELQRRGLFETVGEKPTLPVVFCQSIDDAIERYHSMSSLSRAVMSPAAADEFDAEMRRIMYARNPSGMLDLQVVGSVVWGVPTRPSSGRGEAERRA